MAPAAGKLATKPRVSLSSDRVVATALKPSDDGRGWILRLFGASGKPEQVKINWSPAPRQVWLSDPSEKPLQPVRGSLEVPGCGIVTVRAE